MEFSPGVILDNCRLLAQAGNGSCGTVWQTENIVSGELEALKILSSGGLAERELRALKLYREIRHPSLIRIRHIGQADGTIFYTMDWCESSLAERKVSAKELLEIARKLAAGLALLHANGLLHRDIKPTNIFFHQGSPVLGDIGLLTRQEGATFAGSPGFLSPAILSGKGSADQSSDCYALAKSLYCTLSGHGPEQFPLYIGTLSPEASLLMRAILEVCGSTPSIRTAEQFLDFLNHPPQSGRMRHVPLISAVFLILAGIVCAAAYMFFRKIPQRPSVPVKQKSSGGTSAPPGMKTIQIEKREETEKKFTALPQKHAETLRRLRLSKEASDLINRFAPVEITRKEENTVSAKLTPDQQKLYRSCCAGIRFMQSSKKWKNVTKQWSRRQMEYHSLVRKRESEMNTDSMSVLREFAKQDPLLMFRIRQAECRKAHRQLMKSGASCLEAFISSVKEYKQSFQKVQ